MRNLGILLKNSFYMMIGTFKGKDNNRSTKSAIILFLLSFILIALVFSYNAYTTFDGFRKLGGIFPVFNGLFTILVTLLVLGCLRASSTSQNNDSDFLLSLPIKKYTIILSKTLNKYIYDLFFTLVIFLPYVVMYSIFYGVDLLFILLSILLIFLLPLLSVGLTYIVDFIVTRLFNKTKFAGILKSLFSIFLFGIVFVFIMVTSMNYSFLDASSLDSYFSSKLITNTLLNFLFSPNLLNIFLTLLITILPFILGTLLFTLNYGKTFAGYKSNKTTLKFSKPKPAFNLFLKKELTNYFSSPAYMINTAIGPVMMIVFSILIASLNLGPALSELSTKNSPSELILGLSALVLSFLTCTSTITAASISLEGKNLWLIKSSPVRENTILFSKLFMHNIVVQPIVILSSIFLSIFNHLSFLQAIFLILIPFIMTLNISIIGLFINLKFPVLDYTDEAKVVKQSLSVTLTMLLGLVLSLLPLLLFILTNLSILTICFISLSLYLVLFVIFSLLLFTKGVKLFRKL